MDILISDLHLSPHTPELNRALQQFTNQLDPKRVQRLFILGDLFDAWIGDDDPSEHAIAIQAQLRKIANTGIELFVQTGNRDFMLGKQFAKNIRGQLIGNHYVLTSGSERILLMHGDLLCTDDVKYQQYRRKFNNPLSRSLLRRLSLRQRYALVDRVKSISSDQKTDKTAQIMDVNQAAVEKTLRRHRVSTLIHGHTHRPNIHTFTLDQGDAKRVVLGDWGNTIWWATVQSGVVELQQQPLTELLDRTPAPAD